MEKNLSPAKEGKMPNFITEAQFSLKETQLDFFLFIMAKMSHDDPAGMLYNVYYDHIENITGKRVNRTLAKKSALEMLDKKFKFQNPRTGRTVHANLLASVEPFEGGVQFEFGKKIQEYMVMVKKQFTSYQLYSALSMSSKHAKRIYLLCSKWKENEISKVYPVEDLKEMLELEEGYDKWNDFKKRVLDVAVKQINEYSNIHISYNASKLMREYKFVQFFIKKGNPHQTTIDFSNTEFSEAVARINKIAILREYNLRDDQVEFILHNRNWKDVYEKLKKIDDARKEKPIKNLGGYTASALEILR